MFLGLPASLSKEFGEGAVAVFSSKFASTLLEAYTKGFSNTDVLSKASDLVLKLVKPQRINSIIADVEDVYILFPLLMETGHGAHVFDFSTTVAALVFCLRCCPKKRLKFPCSTALLTSASSLGQDALLLHLE